MRTYKNIAIKEAIEKITGDLLLFTENKEIEVKEENFKIELMKATGIKEITAEKWIDELILLDIVKRKDNETLLIKTDNYTSL